MNQPDMSTDVYIALNIVPKLKDFVIQHEKLHTDPGYDIIAEFRTLMCSISDDEMSATVVDAIVNDAAIEPICISEQIKILFQMLMPENDLSKIEFKDKEGRKNFIDYD